jgi:hypothetical protein
VTGWLIAILTALGALLLGLVKADLEDAAVCRWLARHLIYRAALRLPRGERARWRAESLQNVLDLPGRLLPLLWSLDIYVKSGSWGRMRGEPSRWQMLMLRIRVSFARRRARRSFRAMQGPKQRHPSNNRTTVPTLAATSGNATVAIPTAMVTGSANPMSPLSIYEKYRAPYHDGMPHLSDEEFVAWLAQERRDFHDRIDFVDKLLGRLD